MILLDIKTTEIKEMFRLICLLRGVSVLKVDYLQWRPSIFYVCVSVLYLCVYPRELQSVC